MSDTPINNLEPEKSWRDDLKDFVKTSRKAIVSGLGAFAGSIGSAIPAIFADGVVTQAELAPAIVIAVGAALVIGLAVYQVPNDAR